jgi:hypothetical protein
MSGVGTGSSPEGGLVFRTGRLEFSSGEDSVLREDYTSKITKSQESMSEAKLLGSWVTWRAEAKARNGPE